MKKIDAIDAARVELMLGELCLPGIKVIWAELAARADKEGWPAARFPASLAEYEIAERSRRRTARQASGNPTFMSEARLPVDKTIATFDFDAVPMVSTALVMALTAGDGWLAGGANLLMFGPPGGGKSHRAAAISFRSSRMVGACCSCAQPISFSACRWRACRW